jgi:predicted small secreted protein
MKSANDNEMKRHRIIGTILAVSMLLAGIAGCQKQEGPLEQAGKEADRAVEKVGQQIEKAGEKIQDASKDKP